MRTRIRNGTLVTASESVAADLLMEDGRISSWLQPGEPAGELDQDIDATGKLVVPGGVDVHTHLDMPVGDLRSSDDFETGTLAAAFGGTTTIVDYVGHSRGESLLSCVDEWYEKARDKAFVDYGFHMTVAEASSERLREMKEVVERGITSFKVFLAYPERLLLDDASILRVMLRARELGALTCVHAEAGPPLDVLVERALEAGHTQPVYHALTRPQVAEATGTERAVALAEMAGVPVYIVHVSCEMAADVVRRARAQGLPVLAETCPQYLFLTEQHLRGTPDDPNEGAKYVCTPPLRDEASQRALWQALADGTIDTIATDHCPFLYAGQKDRGHIDFTQIPNGLPGIETRQLLLFGAAASGKLSLNDWVRLTATEPARLFGLLPRKGTLSPGADADVVLWDPNRPMRLDGDALHMRVDYSPYEGVRVPGSPDVVLSRGEVIIRDGEARARAGRGQLLERGTSSSALPC